MVLHRLDAIEGCFQFGEIDRLFINFPDPWPRSKNAKRRLTFRTFLRLYSRVLKDGGEIHFKTDNSPLFEFSLEEMELVDEYDYLVINDTIEQATEDILTIVDAEGMKCSRNKDIKKIFKGEM